MSRFKIQICPKRAKAVTIELSNDRSEAITRARQLGLDARVVDRETSKAYSIRLERWIKLSTADVVAGTYAQGQPDTQAEAAIFADMNAESFAQEPC